MRLPARSGSPGKVSDAAFWSSTWQKTSAVVIFNLLKWRPFFLDATVQAFLKPSGVVLGAKVGRRSPMWFSTDGDREDEGLDVAFLIIFVGSFCKNSGPMFTVFFAKVIFVKCNVTPDG
jgi:hypothetical protein